MEDRFLKVKYFERGLSKKLKKVNFIFAFTPDIFFMNTIIKNKRDLELVTSLSSGCKIYLKKFHYKSLNMSRIKNLK